MGVKGPVPKRSDQRRRVNEPTVPIIKSAGAVRVPVPKADGSWHPVALRWYRSLARSGQAKFYEPSDWAVAQLVAESMSRDLSEQVVGVTERDGVLRDVIPLKGASLSAYLRAFSVLLVTEGDRRRAMVELQRKEPDPDDARVDATVTDLRSRLGG
jgi:hypothetical protein